jgi:hypothetical protein
MYGVPADLDLGFLRGAEVVQVCLGLWQVQFHFHPVGSIFVVGRWELVDATGVELDRSYDSSDRPPYQLHRLLGSSVEGTEVTPPDCFALRFAGGDVLRVFDSSDQFESFEIYPSGVVV